MSVFIMHTVNYSWFKICLKIKIAKLLVVGACAHLYLSRRIYSVLLVLCSIFFQRQVDCGDYLAYCVFRGSHRKGAADGGQDMAL